MEKCKLSCLLLLLSDKHHKQKNKKTIESETQASFSRHLIFVTRTHVLRSFIAPVYRTNRVNRYINTAFTRFYSNPALIFCSLHENRNTSIFCRTSAAKKSPRKKNTRKLQSRRVLLLIANRRTGIKLSYWLKWYLFYTLIGRFDSFTLIHRITWIRLHSHPKKKREKNTEKLSHQHTTEDL